MNKELIVRIFFQILFPFCMSIWLLLTSKLFEDFISIILSDYHLLFFLVFSFSWIISLGITIESIGSKIEKH